MSAPYFPFYTQDFFADYRVQELSAEQCGLWVLLLLRMWERDMLLPNNDDKQIARMMRLPLEKWVALRETCIESGLLHDNGDFLISPRLTTEYSKALQKLANSSKGGKSSADKRRGNAAKSSELAVDLECT